MNVRMLAWGRNTFFVALGFALLGLAIALGGGKGTLLYTVVDVGWWVTILAGLGFTVYGYFSRSDSSSDR